MKPKQTNTINNLNKIPKNKMINIIVLLSLLVFAPLIYRFMGQQNVLQQLEGDLFLFFYHMMKDHLYNPIVLVLVYLNHDYEKIINVVVMLSINGLLILHYKDRRKTAIFNLVFLIISLECLILLNNYIFFDLLDIARNSPSLVFETEYISEIYGSALKDYSRKTFPAGHATAFFYWAFCTSLYTSKRVKVALLCLAALSSLPRVFTGSHWVSDVVFSAYQAFVIVYIFSALASRYRFFSYFIYQGKTTK